MFYNAFMSRLEIALFGFPEIKINGNPVETDRRKAVALLAYLAVTGKAHSRDTLAAFLWPDYEQSSAYAYLRRTLWELNQMLGKGWFEADRNAIGLVEGMKVQVDTVEFERLTAAQAEEASLTRAIALYQGDFMVGFTVADTAPFETWQTQQARAYRQLFTSTLERLIEQKTRTGKYEIALPYTQRWLDLEPLDEAAHRTLMQIFVQLGDRVKAIQQYESCCQLLQDELGIEPQQETTQLYEQILRGEISGVSQPVQGKTTTASQPAMHLPLLPTPFIGRRQEVERIKALLHDLNHRLITMTGPGGTGKTRLSIQACSEMTGMFPDGVYFVSLAPVQAPEGVLVAIANALKFSFYQEAGSQQQQLLDFLREKRLLLILDNFEHLAEATGLVGEILAISAGVQLVVTSRVRLNVPGEQLFQVSGMRIPEDVEVDKWQDLEVEAKPFSAVQLFLERAHRVQPMFVLTRENVTAVIQICRLVQGMPLALELAAAWLELLQPDEIAAEIVRSLDFLEAHQVGVPDRQRSIRAVFESSWTLLSTQEQEAFLRLCVFVGTFSREAAQEVSGASLPVLLRLANKSWLQQTAEGRFQLHELMRQYGDEHLRTDEAAWRLAKERHSDYFARFVNEQSERMMGAEQLSGLKALAVEYESNVKAAWDWLVSEQQWDELIDQMLLGLFQFGTIRWEMKEVIPWLQPVRLHLTEGKTQSEQLAFAIFDTFEIVAEEVAQIKDDHPIKRASHLWHFVHEHDLKEAMGFWFVLLAGIVRARNLASDGDIQLTEAIERLREQNAKGPLGISLLVAGNWWYTQPLVGDELIEAGKIFEELGAPYWQGLTAEMSGKLAYQNRRPHTEIIAHYENARRFLQQLEGHAHPSHNLDGLVDVYFAHGQTEKAFALFHEQHLELERRGNKFILSFSLQWEALHAARYSTFDHALAARQRSLKLIEELGIHSNIVWHQFEIGEIYRIFGQPAQALAYYQLAHAGFEKINATLGLGFVQRAYGDLALEKQQYHEALAFFQAYQQFAQGDNHHWSMSQAQGKIALAQAYLGNTDEARREMQQALAAMVATRYDDLALQTLLAEPICLIHEEKTFDAIELASFLQHHHQSWNETKQAAQDLLQTTSTGLDEVAVQAAVERGRKLSIEEVVDAILSPKN